MKFEEHPETLELINHVFTPYTKAWGKYAWSALVQAGKVTADLDEPEYEEYVGQIVTMAALATLAEWFEDDYDLSDFEPTCEILNARYEVPLFNFGRYVESEGIDPYDSDDLPNAHQASINAVLDRTRSVATELKDVLGQSELFTSLWSITYDDEISLPPTQDDLYRTLNEDFDSDKGFRFERLQNL